MTKSIYDVGELPPLGEVPELMHAQLVRRERYGEPTRAFVSEPVPVPSTLAPDEVLVLVMAAGINYNNVWAASGAPADVIAARQRAGAPEPFHIGGSDASGVVWKVGDEVADWKVGDEVVIHCGAWDRHCASVRAGIDPMYSPSFRIWGYELNYGSFAQFTRVQAHQCMPKAKHLSWEAAASPTLVGATAYRMLHGWAPHDVRPDDVVLVWGGAGGVGSMAIQIARLAGARPVAVVSSADKAEFCRALGAVGVVHRAEFAHFGRMPPPEDAAAVSAWSAGARAFGRALWAAAGAQRNPRIVVEHPGEATLPTSLFVCDTGGMVVTCGGTTGYHVTLDLRYHWMRQKRFQGSHFANDEQAGAFNALVVAGQIDPCMARCFRYDQIAEAHQLMFENRHPSGNMAALVGAAREGLTTL